MAVTGTITSAQGTQTLSSSAYDQLTITVASGTYSVEYPVGTAIATGATTTASYQLGGGQCRITVNAGSVAYSLDQVADNYDLQKVKVLTSSEASILAAAGGLTPYATYVASDTGVAGFASDASTLNPGINADGDIESPTGALYALSETSEYVTLTATGAAFTGPCELAGWYCSVAAGNITIYDALSATGTPIVPATALVAGPMPIFGAGTNGKLRLTTGCWVVLSGAATVRVMVGA